MTEPGGEGRADHEDYQPETEPPEPDSPAASRLESFGSENYLPEETASDERDGDEVHTALPGKVEAWRRRSATGAVLTGFALGLQQVFETKRDEPAIIMETSGEPPKDLPIEADFEYGRPRSSVVNIRPWLLPGDEQADDPKAGEPQAAVGEDATGATDQPGAGKDPEGAPDQAGAGKDPEGATDQADDDEGHQEGPES